jgi:hypothetical protein
LPGIPDGRNSGQDRDFCYPGAIPIDFRLVPRLGFFRLNVDFGGVCRGNASLMPFKDYHLPTAVAAE